MPSLSNRPNVLPAMLTGGALIVGGLLAFAISMDDLPAGDAMTSYRAAMHRFFKSIGRGVTEPAILDADVMSADDFDTFIGIVLRGLAGPLEVLGRTLPAEGSVVFPVTLSVAEKELIAETIVLLLVRAYGDDGRRYYAYAAVRADVLASVIEAQQRGGYDLRRCGVILESGGGEPEADVMDRIERDYGFRHDYAFIIAQVNDPS